MQPGKAVLVLYVASLGSAAQFQQSAVRPSVEELIHTIRTGNAYQRAKAIPPLSHIDDSRVVPALMALLKDEDARVRSYAAQQLARLADPQTADALAMALADSSGNVRKYAGEGLARIGDERHVPALVASVVDHLPGADPESYEIWYSAPALEAIGRLSSKAPELLTGLMKELLYSEGNKREYWWLLIEHVAECLGQIGDSTAYGPLRRAQIVLETDYQNYRAWYAVRKALAAIDPEGYSFEHPAADILVTVRLGKITRSYREHQWIEPLVNIGCDAVDDLAWALRFDNPDTDEWQRERTVVAIEALGVIGGPDAAEFLEDYADRLKRCLEGHVGASRRAYQLRMALLALLRARPTEATVAKICAWMSVLDSYGQSCFLHEVPGIPAKRVSDHVKLLLYERILMRSQNTRGADSAFGAAAQNLGRMGGPDAGKMLSAVLLTSDSSYVQQVVVLALAGIRGYDPVPVLVEASRRNNAPKGTIAKTLGSLADERATSALRDLSCADGLAERDRLWIAAALARLGVDYADNARRVREALPDSVEQARWLPDKETVEAVAALIDKRRDRADGGRMPPGAVDKICKRALGTLEAVGTPGAFAALVARIDLETIDDPDLFYLLTTAAARMAEKLGHPTKDRWATVASIDATIRALFNPQQLASARYDNECGCATVAARDPVLARRILIAELMHARDRAPGQRRRPFMSKAPHAAVRVAERIFAPELIPVLERIVRESELVVDFHGRYAVVPHYRVRSLAAEVLTEKTGRPYTYVEVDGRTRPGGWDPSQEDGR